MRGGAGRGGALEWAGLKGGPHVEVGGSSVGLCGWGGRGLAVGGAKGPNGPNVKGGRGLACAEPISMQGAKGVWSGGGGGALGELIG